MPKIAAGIRLRTLAAGLALAAGACVPVVTHGPRVEAGLTGGVVGSLGTRPTFEREVRTDQNAVTPLLPASGAFVRHGWPAGPGGLPLNVSIGLFIPAALPFSITHPEGDLYVQLTPTEHRLAGGAGVLVSRSYRAPYLQLGRDLGEDAEIYTTQSLAFFGPEARGPAGRAWMPALAVRKAGIALFVQGGFGHERQEASTRSVRFLMGGVVVGNPSASGIFGRL